MNTAIPRATLVTILLGACSFAIGQEPPIPAPPPPADHAGGPPPEAFKTCEGKPSGSRSEFTDTRGELLKGVCLDDGHGKMVLRPDRPPAGHRKPPPEAYAACAGKAAGARAQFANPKGEAITGTCESEGGKLVLRPDRPPHAPPKE